MYLLTKGLHTKFKQPLIEILCFQASDFDLCWHQMTFDLHENRGHLLIIVYLHTKLDVQATFSSWNILFTSLTYVDHKGLWATWTTIEMIYSPSVTYIPSLKFKQLLFEILSFQISDFDLCWPQMRYRVYKPRRHTHTHAHTHTITTAYIYIALGKEEKM